MIKISDIQSFASVVVLFSENLSEIRADLINTAAELNARCWSAKPAEEHFETCLWQKQMEDVDEEPIGRWRSGGWLLTEEVEALLFAPLVTGHCRMKFCLQAVHCAHKY